MFNYLITNLQMLNCVANTCSSLAVSYTIVLYKWIYVIKCSNNPTLSSINSWYPTFLEQMWVYTKRSAEIKLNQYNLINLLCFFQQVKKSWYIVFIRNVWDLSDECSDSGTTSPILIGNPNCATLLVWYLFWMYVVINTKCFCIDNS